MDYEDMDAKLKANNIHVAVFCSPHNPTGRVWERWEIEEAMEVYKNNECVVIADEIWSDLILKGSRHIPTQSISPDARNRTIAFYAPSKTFNLAGLVGSYHIVFNRMLRDRLEAKSRKSHYNTMNVLSMHALIGAYEAEGYTWVNELCQVLSENVEYAVNHIRDYYRGINVSKPQGTYMLRAKEEDFIVMGRCADVILANNHIPHISIFITAPFEQRVHRVMEVNNLDHKKAERLLKKIDRQHSKYYNFYTGQKWGDAVNYDICFNSASYGIEESVEIIERMLNQHTNA